MTARRAVPIVALFSLISLSVTCASSAPETPPIAPTPVRNITDSVTAPPSERTASTPVDVVDSLMESLTVRQKVAQLIMPWLLGDYTAFDSREFDRISSWVDTLELGGIIISIGSPLDASAKLNALQGRSPVPLLIAADLEWGSGMRLVGGTLFPMAMALGATGNVNDAYELGRATALEARAAGIHMTFSPVADVNSNPDNPIINTRSFGEDPQAVAALVAAYIHGASEHGLFTTAKHFPGHGDTKSDSHIDLPVVTACWDQLNTVELVPFRAAIEAGVTAVMTAHLAMPCIDGDSNPPPATFSRTIMTGFLRDSLGFDGLVVTDALTMGAIVSKYGVGETVVRAFEAGSDLLLIPADPRVAITAMVAAIAEGRITMERLDESVRRMLELKREAGLFSSKLTALDSIPATVGRRDMQELANDIADRSLTLVQRGPIDQFRNQRGRTAVISYAEETNLTAGNVLIGELRSHGDTVNSFRLYPASGAASYDSARAIIKGSPQVLFAMGVRFIAGRGHIQLPDSLAALIAATDRQKPTVLAALGSPYLMNQVEGFGGAYLLAWSDFPATERAVGRALVGVIPVTGRLPITLSDKHPRGFGIVLMRK